MNQDSLYIWQRAGWPKFRWDDSALLSSLGACRFQQGALLTRMLDLGFEDQQQARAEVLIEEALKTSEIEGERLDPHVVRSSVARRLGLPTAGLSSTRNQHADGVIDILLDATMGFDRELTAERLFGWHAALFPTGYSGLHKIQVAKWRDDRDGAMRVVSGPIGRERIHYEAPPAELVETEMIRFFSWWGADCHTIDGLLRAAIAHLWFVAIHPFEDGNGRIARTITEMALAQDENQSIRYYSLSAQIMTKRELYYAVLDRVNKGDGDITEWIIWFLDAMSKAIIQSNELIKNVMLKTRFWQRHLQNGLSDRQKKVINRLLDVGPNGFEGGLTNRKYAGLVHVSRATAQRELATLVERGVLRINSGGGRSTSYDLIWEQL